MRTAFFLGAGASKADGFPLTRELLCAVGRYLATTNGPRGRRLLNVLTSIYGSEARDWRAAGELWRRLLERARTPKPLDLGALDPLPDITDILSTLDVLLTEQGSIGVGRDGTVLRTEALASARAQIMRAISIGLSEAHDALNEQREQPGVNTRFVAALSGDDLLVTTNWDILLDRAHRRRFGTTERDYAVDARVEDTNKRRKRDAILSASERVRLERGEDLEELCDKRPRLLKLHGSVNWLHCPRCSRLEIDVPDVTAIRGLVPGSDHGVGRARRCACGAPLEALIVTPTFVKNYHNRHLLNIWSAALAGLAECDRWVFVGYSLPADDIHIKTLLLKARQMRRDRTGGPPLEITVVTHRPDADLERRFRRLFGEVELRPRGFESYVKELEAKRRGADRAATKITMASIERKRAKKDKSELRKARERIRRRKQRALLERASRRAPVRSASV